MAEKLKKRLKQEKFEGPAQEAILNLLVASALLRNRIEAACSERGISSAQYNVLRILRGRYPEGYARCDIITRMIERAPDVTRLIDRLVTMGLVERKPSLDDRRLSIACITEAGLSILSEMDPVMKRFYAEISTRISDRELADLSALCEKFYEAD